MSHNPGDDRKDFTQNPFEDNPTPLPQSEEASQPLINPFKQESAPPRPAQRPSPPATKDRGLYSPKGDEKSRIIAVLLAFFLGFLGGHNFYIGHYKKAATQLAIYAGSRIVTSGDFQDLIAFALLIWVIADIVRILLGSGPYSNN